MYNRLHVWEVMTAQREDTKECLLLHPDPISTSVNKKGQPEDLLLCSL